MQPIAEGRNMFSATFQESLCVGGATSLRYHITTHMVANLQPLLAGCDVLIAMTQLLLSLHWQNLVNKDILHLSHMILPFFYSHFLFYKFPTLNGSWNWPICSRVKDFKCAQSKKNAAIVLKQNRHPSWGCSSCVRNIFNTFIKALLTKLYKRLLAQPK